MFSITSHCEGYLHNESLSKENFSDELISSGFEGFEYSIKKIKL